MNIKIKEKIKDLSNELKRSIEKFPITILAIAILTLIFFIFIDNDNVDWQIIFKISVFILIFTSLTFLIETLLKEKNKKNILYYIISAIWSGLLTALIFGDKDILGIDRDLIDHYTARIIACHFIITILLSIYFNYKKSEKTFEEYLTHVEVSIFKNILIYSILAIGVAVISSIFIFLILNGKGVMLLPRLEILLLGLFFVPKMIYTMHKPDDEIGRFTKIVIKYVLGSLVMIAFAIIYMYLIKIIILRDIPSNQIFRILASLFCIGLPIWTMCMSLDDGTTFDKINKKLPLLFIPFIFLQIYSIGVRIASNGLTEPRYLCVMLIIFEIIYTTIYVKNRTKIGTNLLVIIMLVVISTIMPYVNMFKLSAINQYNIMKKYYGKDNLTKEEQYKVTGAYRYLKYSVVGEKYIEGYDVEDKYYDEVDEYYKNIKRISADADLEYINIEGYKKLYYISADDYTTNEETIDEVFKNVIFDINNGSKTVKINMLNLVKQYIQLQDSLDKKFDDINELIINNNRKIILDSVYISYNEKTNELISYDFSGYLLER